MLASHVVEIFEASRGTYGARRVAAELCARGKAAGVRQVPRSRESAPWQIDLDELLDGRGGKVYFHDCPPRVVRVD